MDVVGASLLVAAVAVPTTFTYLLFVGIWRLIEGSWPKHVVWVAKKLKPKKRVKPAPVNAIEDLANFKKSMRTRQREEWEKAYIAICPPRPPIHQKWVEYDTTRQWMDSAGAKHVYTDGYYVEDKTPQERWDREWLRWKYHK